MSQRHHSGPQSTTHTEPPRLRTRARRFIVNCIKYFAVFILALAIPAYVAGQGSPTAGAALLIPTLAVAAWYGKRLFGLR